ncbi:MAG: hypothetical protein EOM47_13925 [Bacteroidia bacterium]|nr:hypothetical protein [Bacteroidia bacterium]
MRKMSVNSYSIGIISEANNYKLIGLLLCFLILNSCSNKEKNNLILDDNYDQILANKISISEKENSNLFLKDQVCFLGNDSLNTLRLIDFVSENNVFFCFSEVTCTPCIEQTIEIVMKVFPDYKQNENIIFVSPDYDKRYRDNCYGKKLLTLKHSKFGIPIEDTEAPFFLIINDRLQVISIHIVNNFDYDRTEKYLRDIAFSLH